MTSKYSDDTKMAQIHQGAGMKTLALQYLCGGTQLMNSNTKRAVFIHSVMSDSLPEPARLLCPWGFSRQECWSELPCPPPGDLPNPGMEPRSPTLQVDFYFYHLSYQWSPKHKMAVEKPQTRATSTEKDFSRKDNTATGSVGLWNFKLTFII